MRPVRFTALATLALVLAAPLAAEAQAPQRVFRIGILSIAARPPDVSTYPLGFIPGLRARGWVEGQHYVLEYRFADGRARLPALAAELVALPVDVILAISTPAALAAKAATTTVPIVFQSGSDPIQRGLVTSFAHPGGNLTGYTYENLYGEKQLQLLKEAVPRMSRVGVLDPCPDLRRFADMTAVTARALGVQIQCIKVEQSQGLAGALASIATTRVDGLVVMEQAWTTLIHYKQIAEFTTTHKIPSIGEFASYTGFGGLLYYGPKVGQAAATATALVDKILRGAKPADLPVEQPTTFELVVNLKTAKAIGLTIPPSVLVRADQVIE